MPDAVASEMKRVRTEASRQMKLQQANCERNSQKSSESHKSSQPGWSLASQNSSKPPLTLTSNSGESTEEEEQSYRKKRKTDWDTSSESESEERRKRQQKQADSNNAWTGGHVLDAYDEVLPKLQWYLDILPVFFPRKDGDQKRNAYRALRQIWYTMDEVESERLANSPEYFGFECIEKSPRFVRFTFKKFIVPLTMYFSLV